MRLKSIKMSRKTGECVIVTAYIADEYSIREAIENLGFKVLLLKREPYIKKSIFDFLQKNQAEESSLKKIAFFFISMR